MKLFYTFLLVISFYSSSSFCQETTLLLPKTSLDMWNVQINLNVTGTGAIKDGTFFYVTDQTSNLIRAYDVSGNLLYTFAIPGVSGLRDLTFDGTFEYGGTGSSVIYQMNFPSQTLIGTISTPIAVRYIAYDSDNDAFWIGTWNQPLMLVSRNGVVLNTVDVQLNGIGGIACDNESPGGPYLWIFNQNNADSIMIYQYSFSTGTFTGVAHNVLDDVGIGQTGAVPGGLFFMNQFIPNTYSLGGVLVGSPVKLFAYEIFNGTPVELVSFTAFHKGDKIELNWLTSTETNNKGFEVQRSRIKEQKSENGWTKIGFVEGNGTTTHSHSYSFIDKNINSGKYYYRLKQIDFDGSFHYSKSVEINVTNPVEFSLSQNYPNPFNPVTTINYSISAAGISVMQNVRLKVYDILGNEVATLVNGAQTAGEYEVKFDASGLSSGLYFYRLTADKFSSAHKMLLLK